MGINTVQNFTRTLYLVAQTIYSCQTCGGMCQIKDDMKTDGQLAIARLKGEDGEEAITKLCPYCQKQRTFKKIMREPMGQ